MYYKRFKISLDNIMESEVTTNHFKGLQFYIWGVTFMKNRNISKAVMRNLQNFQNQNIGGDLTIVPIFKTTIGTYPKNKTNVEFI